MQEMYVGWVNYINATNLEIEILFNLKLPSRDRSWMGDYTTCGSCHLAHTARFALAPHLLQRYDQWVSRTNYG